MTETRERREKNIVKSEMNFAHAVLFIVSHTHSIIYFIQYEYTLMSCSWFCIAHIGVYGHFAFGARQHFDQ